MTTHVDRKLEELGLSLPEAAAPVAAYVPVVEAGGLLHLSGQLPFRAGQLVTGRLGDGVSLEDGQEAAKLCGLMIVAQVKKYLGGDLSRVKRVVKLGVFVNSAADFTDQPKVANGASELWSRCSARPASMRAARSACRCCRSARRSRWMRSSNWRDGSEGGERFVPHAPSASACAAPISTPMSLTIPAA